MGDSDDPPDFQSWVGAHGDALMRFAYLVTGDHDRAADAVQDALVAVCQRWQRIVARGSPDAYLRRCVVNADTSRWRRFLRMERLEPDPTLFAEPGTGVDTAGRVVLEDAMWSLCLRLPARQRAAIVLRYYEDYADAEIAAVLDCSVSTVRSQIHRGLATLRDRIGETEEAVTP
ncbi:SigE family RNA polymerase sigma factor [Actinophytocola oryzae]|uniref:RNA polymerase sigma-70 factor (Sigma-E family) n=1 Tax=Actinophytocola oryzae TaxID=502181 RepID=A0A4R7W203_9PSEU|nr:SigE family RNA polymerase sigma factor [Actinophytocola oryzae]TDV56606.1 RNA polymerase sigma-70 factor (sigma-E family) [Actinophytocola oryzae]